MLSIEIRVNGIPVGMIEAYRSLNAKGYTPDKPRFTYPYRGSVFNLNHEEPPAVYVGSVDHDYDDGIEKLIAKILADIAENSPPAG